jgi:hypothetical protein
MKPIIIAVAACVAAAACATPTPYQPYRPGAITSGGFSDLKISSDRVRVTFAGNSITSRETVERYLLFRAAELTVDAGYDWFATVDRRTDRDSRTIVHRDPFGYDYWRPQWAYLGNGRWVMLNNYWGPDPFWSHRDDYQRIDRYEASAEIFMGKGPKPADDRAAYDAREVIANLGPTIVRPTA